MFNFSNLTMRQRKIWSWIIRWIIALILIAFSTFPVLWIISSSFNPSNTLASASLIPSNIGLGNYVQLFTSEELPFARWIWNSIKISTITTILSVTITTFAAYAFSRFRFKGRVTMLKGILLVQVFPSLLALIAVFTLITQFESIVPAIGLDTHAGLILVYLGGAMGV
ncbi:MAG: arabinogalactan oligomer/maltooligosaccharide transport system permease protein, partial [Cellvibrionaceae bacterium]